MNKSLNSFSKADPYKRHDGKNKPSGRVGTDTLRQEIHYYLYFLLWPFGVLLIALQNWKRSWTKNILWIFCFFFGYLFIIPKDGISSPDCLRYVQMLTDFAHSDTSLDLLWSSFYSASSGSVDIIQPLVTFFVSRITDDPALLFAVYGLIFGFFFSRNLWYVLEQKGNHLPGLVLIFTLTFVLLNPVWNINGFRMWTAAHIFLYGTLPFLLEGKRKMLAWSFASVLVHFSFLFAIGILLLFLVFRNRLNIYFYFFLATAFITEINLQWVQSALTFLPDFLQPRIGGYANAEYAEQIRMGSMADNWYVLFYVRGVKLISYLLVAYVYSFCRKHIESRKDLLTLLCFSLLLYSFSNLFSLVPSGDRFIIVSSTFLFPFFIIFISSFPQKEFIRYLGFISIPFQLLFCAISLRIGLDFISLSMIFGNPLFAVFYKDDYPLITGISRLF